MARALRLPNDFAEAHWLIDYRFGFTKRGLAGSVLSLVCDATGTPVSRPTILALSAVAFLVYGAALAFLSSPFVVMSAHLFGYLDSLIVVLSLFAIALLFAGRTWLAAALLSAAVLVHETTLLVGFPAFCLATWLLHRDRPERERPPVLALVLPLVAFGAVVASRLLVPADDLRASLATHLSEYPFIAADRAAEVPLWHTMTFVEHLASLRNLALRIGHPYYYLLVLPTVAGAVALYRNSPSFIPRAVYALLAVITLPQAMHVVAWDTTRIWTYSILCAFLGLWVFSETRPLASESPSTRYLFFGAILLHAAVPTPLMDQQAEHFGLAAHLLLYLPTFLFAFRPRMLIGASPSSPS